MLISTIKPIHGNEHSLEYIAIAGKESKYTCTNPTKQVQATSAPSNLVTLH